MIGSPLLQRCALGLWFLALGALGLLRWWMRYARDAQVFADAVMHIWLWGSLALAAIGLIWIARAVAAHRRHRDARP
ncbi:hypothetical protein [Lysobacter arvi]|uniref:Uncharacterized protein n=1 Tax=Lysobacter arvi TaxID=3038776 RepID=A0ABU1CEC2_9GAMM|nr:hypothetical protein [Lysobacter arvi]MDR0183182.1 hypothetical protein [Lysobacter arvi]